MSARTWTNAIGSTAPPVALRWGAVILGSVGVPLFLLTTNVLQVTNDSPFYQREFQRYQVSRTTGLNSTQLGSIADAFIRYFAGDRSAIAMQVDIAGTRRPLFSPRELAHMDDVYNLLRLVRLTQVATGLTLLGLSIGGLAGWRRGFSTTLGRYCIAGGALTLIVLSLLGALAATDFGEVFVEFHLLAFSNDLWMLDPTRDYLIMLFPEGFWFDATVRIATLTAIEAAAFVGLGIGSLTWAHRR